MGCLHAAVARDTPAFYVVEVKDGGHALVHSTSVTPPKGELRYVPTDGATASCCVRAGRKPGTRVRRKITRESDKASGGQDRPMYQHAGYLVRRPGSPAEENHSLAFGIEGMRVAKARNGRTHVITVPTLARPVIVRQCTGIESLHFRLYDSLTAKKPYARYSYYLGYDTDPDCD